MKIENLLKDFKPLVDKKIKELIKSNSYPNLYDGIGYAISSGGKRLRPALCLAVCKALEDDIEKALPFAACIEILHNATLVHDDIEDGDELRRGLSTVWKKYGIEHAINIGDSMIFKSYECLLQSKLPSEKILELADMFTDTVIKIIEGQNMELNFREKDFITVEEYVEMASKKAGVLFGLALSGGALIADASRQNIEKLMEYGKKIGLAFQIRDDVLNLAGKQKDYGKEIYGDIKEGKRTLITIHCLKNCNDAERKKLLEILKRGRENVGNRDVGLALTLIKKYDSIQFAKEYAENLIKESKKDIEKIDDRLKNVLQEFADFMAKREY